MVDHINGNTLDNRRSNLQLISRQGNSHKGCVQKIILVDREESVFILETTMWQAGICINKKTRHLGTFPISARSIDVYNIAKEELLDSLDVWLPKMYGLKGVNNGHSSQNNLFRACAPDRNNLVERRYIVHYDGCWARSPSASLPRS